MPSKVEKFWKQETDIKEDLLKTYKRSYSVFYLGRGLDYNLAMKVLKDKRNILYSCRSICSWRIKAWYNSINRKRNTSNSNSHTRGTIREDGI